MVLAAQAAAGQALWTPLTRGATRVRLGRGRAVTQALQGWFSQSKPMDRHAQPKTTSGLQASMSIHASIIFVDSRQKKAPYPAEGRQACLTERSIEQLRVSHTRVAEC